MSGGYLLDTDSTSLFLHHKIQQPHLVGRVLAIPAAQICISIVTVEETLQGAFAPINHPKTLGNEDRACEFLRSIFGDLSRFRILPYDAAARQVYKNMTAAEKRVGTNDCKIAAIAMSRGYVVVTRNVKDFARINSVVYEDWTLP